MPTFWEQDPESSHQVGFHTDPATGDLTILHREDVEFCLQKNRAAEAISSNFERMQSSFYAWARISPGVYYHILKEEGVDILKTEDWEKVKQLLHSPDYKYLKTAKGEFRQRPTREYLRASTPTNTVVGKIGRKGHVLRRGGL